MVDYFILFIYFWLKSCPEKHVPLKNESQLICLEKDAGIPQNKTTLHFVNKHSSHLGPLIFVVVLCGSSLVSFSYL